MKASEFAKRLLKVGRTKAELQKAGVTATNVERFFSAFRCVERQGDGDHEDATDEAVSFVSHWDASTVEIGAVRFLIRASKSLHGSQIGVVNGDPLVVRSNGAVVVVDSNAPSHVLWPAAESGGKLLDALLVSAQFFAKRMVGEVDFDDRGAARIEAKRCSDAAGGADYYPFFSMLLGAET